MLRLSVSVLGAAWLTSGCEDVFTYRDARMEKCSYWEDKDCDTAIDLNGFEADDVEELKENCCVSCGLDVSVENDDDENSGVVIQSDDSVFLNEEYKGLAVCSQEVQDRLTGQTGAVLSYCTVATLKGKSECENEKGDGDEKLGCKWVSYFDPCDNSSNTQCHYVPEGACVLPMKCDLGEMYPDYEHAEVYQCIGADCPSMGGEETDNTIDISDLVSDPSAGVRASGLLAMIVSIASLLW